MKPRHEQRDRLFSDTTPFFTYRRGAVVPDNSKGRTPIGTMSNEEIYGPALNAMPSCISDACNQGRRKCPHPNRCMTDDQAPSGFVSVAREFIDVYRTYRIHHGRLYALRSAYRIAIQGIPF